MDVLDNLVAIEFDSADHVATVTLNRPAQMNSFNEQMATELVRVWTRVREDDEHPSCGPTGQW